MDYLFSISIALSTLFFTFLIFKNEKRPEHYFLASIFLMASFNVVVLFILYQNNGTFYLPFILELHVTIPVLYGIAVYFYAKTSIQSDYRFSKHLRQVLALFVLYFLCVLLNIHLNDCGNQIWNAILYAVKPGVNALFLIATLRLAYRIKTSENAIPPDLQHRRWLLWLAWGGLFICGISVTGFLLGRIDPLAAPLYGDYAIGSFLSIYFFMLGFTLLRNTVGSQNHKKGSSRWMLGKQLNPTIIEESVDLLTDYNQLSNFMIKEQVYLDPRLSLHKLSEKAEIPITKLSRLINQGGQTNFYDFVNSYRVEAVKAKMMSPQFSHLSLLGIALNSGFNSKASFNRCFKKLTGQTPSAYRKQHCKKRGLIKPY